MPRGTDGTIFLRQYACTKIVLCAGAPHPLGRLRIFITDRKREFKSNTFRRFPASFLTPTHPKTTVCTDRSLTANQCSSVSLTGSSRLLRTQLSSWSSGFLLPFPKTYLEMRESESKGNIDTPFVKPRVQMMVSSS
ncbi:Uncharacterized protein DAT39_017929 [Clarias magur]|uniref:Uncharacterized protein n=1 Tax=Clarias magur TaxID=1594786 RepID=A0A8J4T9V2_CLAMG|nr:Uncharacterized protein DAT39_017929 [Clarias magur]